MNTLSKFAVGLLFGLASTIHADGYLSIGGGASTIGTTTDSNDTAYKIALGFEVVDNMILEIHHANLGETDDGTTYKYTAIGGNYYFGSEDDTYNPFVGGGVAKYTTSGTVNKEVQAYGTGGVKFTLDKESGLNAVVSYTKYADDASAVFLDISQGF